MVTVTPGAVGSHVNNDGNNRFEVRGVNEEVPTGSYFGIDEKMLTSSFPKRHVKH